MEIIRDKKGFIDLSKLIEEGKAKTDIESIYIIFIEGKKYFFKPALDDQRVYNELIAEEIANDYLIPCAHYDLATLGNEKGVISEDVLGGKLHYYVTDLLKEDIDKLYGNNLTDIWTALDNKYHDRYITEKLMDQLTSIFMFDILIANSDRHDNNLIIEDDGRKVNFAPLIDNEGLLSYDSINYQEYSLSVDSGKNTYLAGNLVNKFLSESDSSYIEFLENSLWIIEDKNIDKVLKRIEKRIESKIPNDIKENIKINFEKNRIMIKKAIENKKAKRMG